VIFWGDETGLRADELRGRSDGPYGQRPVVRPSQKRASIGLVSAVTNKGEVLWMVLDRATVAGLLIVFLQRLIREADGKAFLILDHPCVHHARTLQGWLARHRTQIEVVYLPSYTPELNPDEGLNADLRHALPRKPSARSRQALKRARIGHMRRLSKLPVRIRSYFQQPSYRYNLDSTSSRPDQ
jgi:hypothetical protein